LHRLRKKGKKPFFVCRLHDYLCRKSQRLDNTLPELINDYNEVVGYKVNTQSVFLHISNEQMEFNN
jgi:hypothetical protein